MATAGWQAAGFFALRTTLLPFDALLALSDPGEAGDAVPTEAEVRSRMVALARRPDVREALFLASPVLEEALTPWLAGEDGVDAGGRVRSLVAYLARMAARPTPFGLFAGTAVGRVAERTVLSLSGEVRRRTRPDIDYLVALTARLGEDRPLRHVLRWRPNSSLYRSAGRLRMVETRLLDGVRSHHLVALEPDDALLDVLTRAQEGERVEELAAGLVDGDISLDDAVGYIHELIDAQVLVSDLTPAVTGPEPLDELVAQLRRLGSDVPAAAAAGGLLADTGRVLREIDRAGPGTDPSRYRDLGAPLTAAVPGSQLSRLFQVDMFRPGDTLSLSPPVVAEAARGADLLARLEPRRTDPLASFREAFVERYEDAEVPLLEALDEESGIGFDVSKHPAAEEAPLLVGLELGRRPVDATAWSRRDAILLRIVTGALRTGRVAVELDDELIGELADADATSPPSLGPTVSVMARIAAASCEDVDEGRFRLLVHAVTSASGAQLLGRFCHGDPDLDAGVRRLLHAEEAARPEAAFAEIVHLPEGRIGNILCRPVLREHEIVYLGRSGAPTEAQLDAADLLVSARGDRVVLRSRRLEREVVPRLTSAHNTALRSVGLYRFLAALQHQGGPGGVAWDWGGLAAAPFLPRISSGRLVLARATWRVRGLRVPADLQRLRVEVGLPRWVGLAAGDNELAFDVDNPVLARAALELARREDEVSLVELFPPAGELCVVGPGGRYVHELILPLVRPTPATVRPAPPPRGRDTTSVRRAFPPGSEWLYAKLYTGTGTANSVLREAVGPVVRAATASGAVDRWFFLRYGDPHHHLRIRFHGDPARLRDQVEPLLHEAAAPLLADGRVWRMTYDTYQPEIERYGGPHGVELSEAVFRADSDAVLGIVERLAGDAGLTARWQLTLAGIDRLLSDFGFPLEARHTWARGRRDAYLAEFGGGPALTRGLGERWRRHGRELVALLAWSGELENPLAPGLAALARRSEAIIPLAAELRARAAAGMLDASLEDIVASLAHMHAIRLLRSAPRAQELVLYELALRAYTAQLARSR